MKSEAESFLGIQESPPLSNEPIPKGILRSYWTWIILLVGSYGLSFLWITGFVICVPYVLMMAPLGLTSLFNPPLNSAHARTSLGPTELMIHLIFWSLFFTGLITCKRLNINLLRIIFSAIIVILILTMYGCARYYHCDTSQIN